MAKSASCTRGSTDGGPHGSLRARRDCCPRTGSRGRIVGIRTRKSQERGRRWPFYNDLTADVQADARPAPRPAYVATLDADAGPHIAGVPFSITATALNSGPGAGSPLLTVSGFGLLRVQSMSASGGSCPAGGDGLDQYTCSLGTAAAGGGSASAAFVVIANDPGTFQLAVTPRGNATTLTPGSLTVTVGPPVVNLAVVMSPKPLNPALNSTTDLTISLTNMGPSPLTSPATISVTLPAELKLSKAQAVWLWLQRRTRRLHVHSWWPARTRKQLSDTDAASDQAREGSRPGRGRRERQ